MIKNIIFDVGEVLLGYRWKDMLMDYGMTEEQALYVGNMMFEDPLWQELDLAERHRDEIIAEYIKKYPDYEKDITYFMTHGEYMHVPREDVWEKVHELRQTGYRIYILSNYSEELFQKHIGGAPIMEDVDGVVVSYMIHKKKPDPAIYRHLLDTYKLIPEESIFFDDRKENTEAARALGIQAVTIRSKEQLLEELKKVKSQIT